MSWKKDKIEFEDALKHIGDYMVAHSVDDDYLKMKKDMRLIKNFIETYRNTLATLAYASRLLEQGYFMLGEEKKNKYNAEQWLAHLNGDEIPEGSKENNLWKGA